MQIDLNSTQLERFIVFEGMDGSGQDTQAELLADHLRRQGFKVWLTSEPSKDFNSIGLTIRYILANTKTFPPESLQLLMVADRALHLESIKKYLSEGYVVICVRYLYSTLAYGFADGLDIGWLVSINRAFARPKLAIGLDLPAGVALERVKARAARTGQAMDRFENIDHLSQVRNAFTDLATLCPELRLIDASGSMEEVAAKVAEVAEISLGLATASQKSLDLQMGS